MISVSDFLDGNTQCPGQRTGQNIRKLTLDEEAYLMSPEGQDAIWEHCRVELVEDCKRTLQTPPVFMPRVAQHEAQQLLWELEPTPQRVKSRDIGPREFTLTYSPTWFGDVEARKQFHTALERLVKYYRSEIVQFRAVGEVSKGGLSHVHCYYELEGGKKITDKNFQRAYPRWDTSVKLGKTGHQGGHHATVKDIAGFKGYIEEDLDTTAWLNINLDDIV